MEKIISKKEASDGSEKEGRCWSDLDTSLLCSIHSRLYGQDKVRFNFVCKTWNSVSSVSITRLLCQGKLQAKKIMDALTSVFPATQVREIMQFPTLVFSGQKTYDCKLFNPLMNTTYRLICPELANTKIRYSKGSWLLVSQGKYTMFFFNPFTEDKVDLPDLPMENNLNEYEEISFSSLPTLPDCVVMAFNATPCGHNIEFICIRRGESTWRNFMVGNHYVYKPRLINPFFLDGAFYNLTRGGIIDHLKPPPPDWDPSDICLCILDPTTEGEADIWKQEKLTTPLLKPKRFYLLECEGELMVAVLVEGRFGKTIDVYKLDRSTKELTRVESLGDMMLFLSEKTSFSASTKGEFEGMENKIYLPMFKTNDGEALRREEVEGGVVQRDGVFYSLSTKKFHSLGFDFTSQSLLDTTKASDNSVWILPNLEEHSIDELTWY